MNRLLIICHDVIAENMAGPGIRYWQMARALGHHVDTTLAIRDRTVAGQGFATASYTWGCWETLAPLVQKADVILCAGDLLLGFEPLARAGKPLIIEAQAPYTFESLALYSHSTGEEQQLSWRTRLEVVRRAMRAGDFYFCASERQRDYWLGVLDAFGRINPHTYAGDPTLRGLIDVVPFGLPAERPRHHQPVLRDVIPGIGPDDRIVLWGGGLWQWLDPSTLIRAVARLADDRDDVRLVFPGTRHPNPAIPDMPATQEAMALSRELGLTGKTVFFGDWIPHDQWSSVLLEADIGVSLHHHSLESRFAFRTRLLDYIWAALPMVVTGGDATSELVARYNIGRLVPAGDVDAVYAAIAEMLANPRQSETLQAGFQQAWADLTWDKTCQPLVRFCQAPRRAQDHALQEKSLLASAGAAQQSPEALKTEIDRLQALVHGYENGRFMRFMRWLKMARRKGSTS